MGKYYLYRHVRLDKNEPFYIGIGTKGGKIQGIRTEYKRAYTTHKRSIIWKRIVAKSNYFVEILCESDSVLFIKEREKDFIKLYGRKDLKTGTLVNLTDGGDGRLGATKTTLNNGSNLKIFSDLRKRKCYQYSLDGFFMKEWDSLTDIMEYFNVNSVTPISNCCKRVIHTYKGFRWFYEYKGETIDEIIYRWHNKNKQKKIAQLDKITEETIRIFNSTMDVQREFTFANTAISAAALGKVKTAYGYKWKYI